MAGASKIQTGDRQAVERPASKHSEALALANFPLMFKEEK